MWNEFLPISMPITAGELSSFRDMACSCLRCPLPAFAAGRAGARPDHSISRLLQPSSKPEGRRRKEICLNLTRTKNIGFELNIEDGFVTPRLSILVLPFANLSNDPDQDYFADGLTD